LSLVPQAYPVPGILNDQLIRAARATVAAARCSSATLPVTTITGRERRIIQIASKTRDEHERQLLPHHAR